MKTKKEKKNVNGRREALERVKRRKSEAKGEDRTEMV